MSAPGLTPTQQKAFDGIAAAWPIGQVFTVWGGLGMGKTRVLEVLARHFGGRLLGMKALLATSRGEHPLALEESLEKVLTDALEASDVVLLDDLHMLDAVIGSGAHLYPRREFIQVVLGVVVADALSRGKRLVFAHEGRPPGPVYARAHVEGIKELRPADYEAIARADLGEAVGSIDFAKLHRFAPRLNGHQLHLAFTWTARGGQTVTTERLVEYLQHRRMASNVDLGEVQPVQLGELKGLDRVLEDLEAKIILPLENDVLANELGIKPKRGVLIAGPPGTGKTTIGRALAHRLKSKFFLIDGTFISGTRQFYERVAQVFEAAKNNAPSILFIDDSDVIFENGSETGLYRYLLTMLDGLESESANRVCVMMTAMNVGHLPPALVRSGRIELWLETSLPDDAARRAILEERLAALPAAMGAVDAARLAQETEGLTGADLKQLVEDGKLLYAYDRAKSKPLRPATEYFSAAVETVKQNRARYSAAEAAARANRPVRPPWFDGYNFGGGAQDECC